MLRKEIVIDSQISFMPFPSSVFYAWSQICIKYVDVNHASDALCDVSVLLSFL